MSDVLDLTPHLRKKKAAQCKHNDLEISMTTAEVSCSTCGAALDPWWVLRDMVTRADDHHNLHLERVAQHNAWCERANATVKRLSEEIARLTELQNRLWATPGPDGRRLHAHRRSVSPARKK